MGTGRAELDTTTSTAGAAGAVASVVEGHVRGLPNSVQDGAGEVPVVRGWTVTGGTAAEVLRVTTDVRQVLSDAAETETVDDGESYAQLLGIGRALRAAGFVVGEVLEGWRTVAVDVAAVAADSDVPTGAPKREKPMKAKKAKKVQPPKAPKSPKKVKTGRANDAGVAASDVSDQSDSDSGADADAVSAPAPKKNRGGLLRRRSAPLGAELADEAGAAATGAGSEGSEDADKDLASAAAA